MNAVSSKKMSGSVSDNRDSAIQNLKWLGLSVIAFVLVAAVAVVQAQQAGKISRIGVPGCKHCFWYRGPLGGVPARDAQAWMDRGKEYHHRVPIRGGEK